jgi:hypothetical protein
MHHNPVTGKWMLANDFLTYVHSSASFYEGVGCNDDQLIRIEDML